MPPLQRQDARACHNLHVSIIATVASHTGPSVQHDRATVWEQVSTTAHTIAGPKTRPPKADPAPHRIAAEAYVPSIAGIIGRVAGLPGTTSGTTAREWFPLRLHDRSGRKVWGPAGGHSAGVSAVVPVAIAIRRPR